MPASERDVWLLNFYRNSELHGALLMGKLSRTVSDPALVAHLTRHCATEAHHAALLSDALERLGAPADASAGTIQAHYAAAGGVPLDLMEILTLSETLEKRVVTSYQEHRARPDVDPVVRETLTAILREMTEEEDGEHAGWIDRVLEGFPHEAVEQAEAKWRAIDDAVARDLRDRVNAKFPGRSRA